MELSRRAVLAAGLALAARPSWAAEGPYQAQIEAFLQRDALAPPAPGQVLFVGSSSIRRWTTLETDLAPLDVVRRGFGGAHIRHITHWVEQIVLPYRPREIVIYAGDNDVHYGRSPDETAHDLAELMRRVREDLPEVRFTFLTIKPSPARWADWPAMSAANALVRAQAGTDPRLRVVDVASPLLDAAGQPLPALYASDGLHLSAEGNAIWAGVLRAAFVETAAREPGAPGL